jgi:hypothetical protein
MLEDPPGPESIASLTRSMIENRVRVQVLGMDLRQLLRVASCEFVPALFTNPFRPALHKRATFRAWQT